MRVSVVAVVACAASASAIDAAVYSLDNSATSKYNSPRISFGSARLWLADRLGLSASYRLDAADSDLLDLLSDDAGDHQQELFVAPQPTRHKVYVIDGLEDPGTFLERHRPRFYISDPPQTVSNRKLATGLLEQDTARRGTKKCRTAQNGHGSDVWGAISRKDSCITNTGDKSQFLEQLASSPSSGLSPSLLSDYTTITHTRVLDVIAKKEGTQSAKYRETLESIREATLAGETRQKITIICMPLASANAKRNIDPYEYDDRQELPLSEPASPAPSSPAVNVLNSTIPKTTIPSCYASESACVASTASCAGHGTCIKKYTEKVTSDEEGAECWSCQCTPRPIKNGESVKTIYWGGPACQKKDISVPFLLFAGFTIAAVTAVSYGVGMLYSIGEEDLPSVLGAGVAPPSRR